MTAVITGASSGLGEEFARQLASRGVNLVLVARSKDKLDALAATLRTADLQVEIIVADLSDPAGLQIVIDMLRDRPIDLLINNAGLGGSGPFETIDRRRVREQVAVNVAALTELTHEVLPGMLQRGSGAILNVASTAAFQPVPFLGVYAATKAYVLSFSEALAQEVGNRGVQVMAFCPGPVKTSFADVAGMNESAMFKHAARSDDVVRSGLAALEAGRVVKISSLGEALMAQSIRITPRWLVRRIAGSMMKPRR